MAKLRKWTSDTWYPFLLPPPLSGEPNLPCIYAVKTDILNSLDFIILKEDFYQHLVWAMQVLKRLFVQITHHSLSFGKRSKRNFLNLVVFHYKCLKMNKYTRVLNSFIQNIEIIILKWRLNVHTHGDATDILQEGQWLGLMKKKFHTDEVKSVQNLVRSSDWST